MKIFCQKSIMKFPLPGHNHISARPPHTISASTRCWCSQVSQVVAMVLLFTKHVLLASQSEGGMKWKILFNWILHVKFDSHWNAVAKSDLQFSRRGGKRYCAEGWQYIGRARRIVQVGVIVLSCFSKHRVLLLLFPRTVSFSPFDLSIKLRERSHLNLEELLLILLYDHTIRVLYV